MKIIIPAAGRGTRFHPITKTVPKEMLPVGVRPMIHYAVEEAEGDMAVIVSSFIKRPLFNAYFSHVQPRPNIVEVIQEQPWGLADAVSTARALIGKNEPFGVVLPDLVEYGTGERVMSKLRRALSTLPTGSSVIALKAVPWRHVGRYGIVESTRVSDTLPLRGITGMVEKPKPEEAKSNLAALGRYILTPEIFDIIEGLKPGALGELQLTDALAELAKRGRLYGLEITEDDMYDCGEPVPWAEANLQIARAGVSA